MKKSFISLGLQSNKYSSLCWMAMLSFLLDWKSIKKMRRSNYSSPLKNKINPLATHHRYKTYLLRHRRFSGYIQMQGFCFSVNGISPQSCLSNIAIKISHTIHECHDYISTYCILTAFLPLMFLIFF